MNVSLEIIALGLGMLLFVGCTLIEGILFGVFAVLFVAGLRSVYFIVTWSKGSIFYSYLFFRLSPEKHRLAPIHFFIYIFVLQRFLSLKMLSRYSMRLWVPLKLILSSRKDQNTFFIFKPIFDVIEPLYKILRYW